MKSIRILNNNNTLIYIYMTKMRNFLIQNLIDICLFGAIVGFHRSKIVMERENIALFLSREVQ